MRAPLRVRCSGAHYSYMPHPSSLSTVCICAWQLMDSCRIAHKQSTHDALQLTDMEMLIAAADMIIGSEPNSLGMLASDAPFTAPEVSILDTPIAAAQDALLARLAFDHYALLGQRVSVYWPAENKAFKGEITHTDRIKGALIKYDDGDWRWESSWRLLSKQPCKRAGPKIGPNAEPKAAKRPVHGIGGVGSRIVGKNAHVRVRIASLPVLHKKGRSCGPPMMLGYNDGWGTGCARGWTSGAAVSR